MPVVTISDLWTEFKMDQYYPMVTKIYYLDIKQDQGSKAPSRDHPNNSYMDRLDYIRVKKTKKDYILPD